MTPTAFILIGAFCFFCLYIWQKSNKRIWLLHEKMLADKDRQIQQLQADKDVLAMQADKKTDKFMEFAQDVLDHDLADNGVDEEELDIEEDNDEEDDNTTEVGMLKTRLSMIRETAKKEAAKMPADLTHFINNLTEDIK